MPRIAKELSDAAVRKLKHGKRKTHPHDPSTAYHSVGGVSGLLLQCRPPAPGNSIGARSWILRTTVGRKRRDIGLGGYPDVTLAMAREKARAIKEQVREGVDPVEVKRANRSALIAAQGKAVTFEQLAEEYMAKKAREYKTAKQSQKLDGLLRHYAFPHIGKLVISDIERAHIVAMLKPIWEEKTESANRTRGHVENILDLAGVKGLRTGDNPARWRGNLELSFPARNKVAKTEHYKALPLAELREFLGKLKAEPWLSARALHFLIMTAARTAEVRGCTWDEIDLEAGLWRIPAERMKNGRSHTVPLCADAVELLEALPRLSDYVFPGSTGKALSENTMRRAMRTLGYEDAVPHGFRSTFRTWVQEYTAYADEVAELALAHVNSDSTRAAYARSELIEKRRLLMRDWQEFCRHGAPKGGSIVAIGSTTKEA